MLDNEMKISKSQVEEEIQNLLNKLPPEILNLNYLEFKERCKDPNFKQLYDLELEVPDPLQEKEIENDESWEDAGDLDELFEKELLKDESKRDPEIMKLHQAMVKAELVFSVAEDFESLDKVYEDLMRDGNSPPPF